MSVVDYIGCECWLINRNVERISAAHAPTDGADAIFFNVWLRLQKIKRGFQVTISAVIGNAAHEFMRHFRRGRNFAAIQINRQRFIALVGQL